VFQGKKLIQWSINNYLGLAENEEIKDIAVKAAQKYGTSAPMGSRMMSGNTEKHIELERKLAEFSQKQASILFNYGYLGVIGTVNSIIARNDIIVIDKLSHASLLDAAFMTHAGIHVFRHNDMDHLEQILKHVNKERKGGILLIIEGVYGMTGDIAKLPDICYLKNKYNARIFIDDAHGYGIMGKNGRGIAEYYGIQDDIDLYFGTFAKAFASIGGMTASNKDVIEWIRYNARTQIFAKSLPMIYVEALTKTLDIVSGEEGAQKRKILWENSKKLRTGLINEGFNIPEVESPIVPVYVPSGDINLGASMIKFLRDDGIFVTGVVYPVIPRGLMLFRMIPTASHTDEDIDITIKSFKKMKEEMNLTI
jgi:glycine C-acetyltransferase